MRGMKRRAFRVLGLTLLCIHFLLCFSCYEGLPSSQTVEMDRLQHTGIASDIMQDEQPADYAVRSNGPYPRPNSPLTLKQTHHLLAIALALILLVLIGSYAVYPTKLNRICIFITSWHLLRAPPKTV